MNPDEFEKRLQRQPIRPIPAEWRREILQQAKDVSPAQLKTQNSKPTTSLREWLWPCPQAWAGLAAVWLVILTLNFATREPAIRIANESTSSPESFASMKEQRRLYLELAELPKETTPSQESIAPRPRSDRRNESRIV